MEKHPGKNMIEFAIAVGTKGWNLISKAYNLAASLRSDAEDILQRNKD